jgi:hypothetical protein
MATELEPLYAANLALDVYDVKSTITRDDFIADYKSDMDIANTEFASGVTGGYIINKQHVMAVFAAGKGKYKGQAFVAIKGTASLYDALTDLNTGVRSSHTGFPVHQGFYYAFNSIHSELVKFIGELKGVSVVHCVGHSLGGAIATLAADWIRASGGKSVVKLYTFGSPRVGLENFASKCSSRLRPENTYRVYHRTDPVPMVPTWPFFHVPYTSAGYLIDSPVAIKPWEYHLMKHYIHSAKEAGTWDKIISNRPPSHLDSAVERWLKSDGILSFSAYTLELLNAALIYVIKKVINLASIAIVTTAAGTLTLLDRMAMFMARAAKVSSDLSIWVFHLVRKMAALIGIKIKEGTDLTVAFIRTVFMRLHRKIADMIWRIGQEVS